MRQRRRQTTDDEHHLVIRTLGVTYGAAGRVVSHQHRCPQFLYAEAGALRAEVAGALWFIPPRRGLWIPSTVPHALAALGPVDLRTLYMTGPLLDWPDVRTVRVTGLLHEAILRAVELGSLDERDTDDRRLAELIAAELRCAPSVPAALTMPLDPRARRLADLFVDDDPSRTLASLLTETGLSRRTAERLFRAETGLSPARWRQQARLADSFKQLLTGAPVADVAAGAGYTSPSAFGAAFKSVMGLTPREVRATAAPDVPLAIR